MPLGNHIHRDAARRVGHIGILRTESGHLLHSVVLDGYDIEVGVPTQLLASMPQLEHLGISGAEPLLKSCGDVAATEYYNTWSQSSLSSFWGLRSIAL